MTRFRNPHRPDSNHGEIVAALRKAGIAVLSLTAVGNGCPDILCAFRETTVLLEIKAEDGKLNAGQVEFIASWPGKVYVVRTAEEAIRVVVEAARPAARPEPDADPGAH